MAFTEHEIAQFEAVIERDFWSHRRPSLHVRDRLWEGQRVSGSDVELFFVRPRFDDPTLHLEDAIAKARFVRTQNEWHVFWKRADMKWHRYEPCPAVPSLEEFLRVVDEDAHGCFFG